MNALPASTDVHPMHNVSITKEVITVNAIMDSPGMVEFATVGSSLNLFLNMIVCQ